MPDQHTPATHGPHIVPLSPKSMVLAFVLWLFLGGLGVHRFYLNRRHGLTILLLALVGVVFSAFGIGLLLLFPVFVWVLIDLFRIPGWVRQSCLFLGRRDAA